MCESYTRHANSKQGMTLFELDLLIQTAKQAGIASGARLTGITSLGGKVKQLTITNDNSPRRMR